MKRALVAVAVAVLSLTVSADEPALRAAIRQIDFERIIREVEAMPSPSVEARALYVYAISRIGARGRASAEAAKLREQHPADPWAWYAISETSEDAIASSEAMMQAAGDRPDEEFIRMRAMALAKSGQRKEALSFLDQHQATPRLTLARVTIHRMEPPSRRPDRLIAELLDGLLAREPNDVEVLSSKAVHATAIAQPAEALSLYERARTLTPSSSVHREYWSTVRMNRELPREKKQELIEADIAAMTKLRGDWPGFIATVAWHYEDSGDVAKATELRDRVLREAPGSFWAQQVRLEWMYAAEDPAEKRKRAVAFIEDPRPYDPQLVTYGWQQLFYVLLAEEKPSREELLQAIDKTRSIADRQPHVGYARPAVALADHGFALDRAEQLARDGLTAVEPYIAKMKTRMDDPSQFEESAASLRSMMADALGWVLFQRGKFVEAETYLTGAWAFSQHSPQIAHHLGRYYESQRMYDRAEELYRTGMTLQTPGKNPNGEALKKLYERRNGSMAGWDAYLESSKNADALSRRKRVLAARHKSPKSAPEFALRTLDGKSLKLADLKGKVAVVNFWGIWCGWCVKEMPDYQKLANKYAGDPDVRILTINNDESADKVKKWMAEQKYDFPVLLDDNFVTRHVRSFPTTWFIDPAGNIAFEQRGWSEKLLEEFTWRIEALR